MKTVLPREQAVEDIFSKILASPEASRRLREVFYQYLDDEHMLVDEDPDHFLQVLFHAYQNGDVSALLLELCGKSMFDLLREAYLIPRKFHGKAGENPVLLTNVEGELLPEAGKMVSAHEYEKFKETFDRHECVPRSGLYLADGYMNGNIQDWRVQIKCPDDTPYQGLIFVLRITIPVSSSSTSHS